MRTFFCGCKIENLYKKNKKKTLKNNNNTSSKEKDNTVGGKAETLGLQMALLIPYDVSFLLLWKDLEVQIHTNMTISLDEFIQNDNLFGIQGLI